MQVIAQRSGDGDQPGLGGVAVLAVAAAGAGQSPTVGFDHSDRLTDLHSHCNAQRYSVLPVGRQSKAVTARRHATLRAAERYGLVYDRDLRAQLLAAIRHGDSIVVERQSNRVRVHDISFDGRTVRVVYDRERREIVTFLPGRDLDSAASSRGDRQHDTNDLQQTRIERSPCDDEVS